MEVRALEVEGHAGRPLPCVLYETGAGDAGIRHWLARGRYVGRGRRGGRGRSESPPGHANSQEVSGHFHRPQEPRPVCFMPFCRTFFILRSHARGQSPHLNEPPLNSRPRPSPGRAGIRRGAARRLPARSRPTRLRVLTGTPGRDRPDCKRMRGPADHHWTRADATTIGLLTGSAKSAGRALRCCPLGRSRGR